MAQLSWTGLLAAIALFLGGCNGLSIGTPDAGLSEDSGPDPAAVATPEPPQIEQYDVVVYGDELPGICAAIWAKKTLGDEARVVLVRPQAAEAMLGGLLTRGGLAYLDFDKTPRWYVQPFSECFLDFLEQANVGESCVHPVRADEGMRRMLAEGDVSLLSDARLKPVVNEGRIDYAEVVGQNKHIQANSFIDTTQQAELAIAAGQPYYRGYESQDADLAQSTLGTSIVPIVEGLTIEELRQIEAQFHNDPNWVAQIEESIYSRNDAAGSQFWMSGFGFPLYQSYRDGYYFRSIAMGAAYHLDRNQPFSLQGFFWDKANVCELDGRSLSWNGFLFKYDVETIRDIEANDLQPTPEMIAELAEVETWLREYSGNPEVEVILPPEIYVRHSVSVRDVVNPLSGQEIIAGGTPREESIATFSYDFDFRGGVDGLSLRVPPLPQYNFGIEHGLSRSIENLAIAGRSSGYEGIAVSVGRINTKNVYHGQGLGVAAALAQQQGVPLNQITSRQVRDRWDQMTGRTTELRGRITADSNEYSQVR
ncbi:MAG: FAD-dependent oxidoreductase [Phormidium sp.]